MPAYLLPPIRAVRKSGSEPLNDAGKLLGTNLLDFWQWSSSNLLDNVLRGTFAEWLVAAALDCAHGARAEWGSYDLLTPSGIKVEVKSAAYIQIWAQSRYSSITFSVREAYAWDPESNSFATQQSRLADVYVFCLLAHRDQETIDPMDVAQWRFYVVPTHELNRQLVHQKGISLATLENRLQARPVLYGELAAAVHAAAAEGQGASDGLG